MILKTAPYREERGAMAATLGTMPVFGPFHAYASGTGPGHTEWFDGPPPTEAAAPWTLSAWVKPAVGIALPTLVAGFGDGVDHTSAQRFLSADATGWFFWFGGFSVKNGVPVHEIDRLVSGVPVQAGTWQQVAATYDGTLLILYVDGREAARVTPTFTRAAMQPLVGPPSPWKEGASFQGQVADFIILDQTLSPSEIAKLASKAGKDFDAQNFTPAPCGATPGNRTEVEDFSFGRRNLPPQPADTLPGPVPPVSVRRLPKLTPRMLPAARAEAALVLKHGWELAEASTVTATPEEISSTDFNTQAWYDATVPGTVLTTLVQQGIYPDPSHGLNNALIPDLATKSWWYRVEFPTAQGWLQRRVEILFKGSNFHAEVWLNGHSLGEINGAFMRGRFDVTALLAAQGHNVLAVRVWPQPHYSAGAGEASVKFGPGENGADALLDGPTFFCTEGWDWNPTTRDRCTGLWQDVLVVPSGAVTVADPQVITKLPKLPDLSVAAVTLKADLHNLTEEAQDCTLEATLLGAHVTQKVSLAPHELRTVAFTPDVFPQLNLQNPELWWPNGQGEPSLHTLTFRVLDNTGAESSQLALRTGLRQVDYDYLPGTDLHGGGGQFFLKVNGRPLFIRGGNWALDDILKRSAKERLEPAFRLHREAGLNMIRNWCGQNTQESFYDLADRYGLLVWNDFWLSTHRSNVLPVKVELFMANVEDTLKRFRHHACIVVWCGRNEGTPPDWLNTPLAESIQRLDGTRIYLPNSTGERDVPGQKLMGSGPWTYEEPHWYYKEHAKGFCTELGINSIPTVDALKAMLDPSQHWPWQDNDAWAHHDFPSKYCGDVGPFRRAAELRYGVGTDLESFIVRMQMLNYTHHRLLYECFNAKMWQPATGVLLWMSHPAWPSMVWQLYTADFDTHAAYYAAKKACEPIHVQWDLLDDAVSVVNTTHRAFGQAKLTVRVLALDATVLKSYATTLEIKPFTTSKPATVDWADFQLQPVQCVKLELHDAAGHLLSENFYWNSDPQKPEHLRALETLPQVTLTGSVASSSDREETVTTVELVNPSQALALMTHLVLRDAADGTRILPAYASDNYVSLLPGDTKSITLRYRTQDAPRPVQVTLDGWNITPVTLR